MTIHNIEHPKEHLRIVDSGEKYKRGGDNYEIVLALLAVAEAFLEMKGSHTAQEHFIAITKELEHLFGFKFERVPDNPPMGPTDRRFYCASCKVEATEGVEMKKKWRFNPGSSSATKNGCNCAVWDNCQGKGRGGNGKEVGWWINGDCPLHGSKPKEGMKK